jgi:Protein of unknown function (DUF3450)
MRRMNKRLVGALVLLVPGLALAQADSQANAGDPVAQYAAVLKETEGLKVYNDLLERQIQGQKSEIEQLQASLESVPDLERQIPPLLLRMVDGLAEFVRLDLPFREEERQNRIAELQLIVERADVNDAEKFRRILEAWQIETEYGTAFETYVGQLPINGEEREVDFLQVGRIALLYQTTDEEALVGAYDKRTGDWVQLSSENRNSMRRALQMARNQIAPEQVLLPLTPPE